jgi:hypothetical protein
MAILVRFGFDRNNLPYRGRPGAKVFGDHHQLGDAKAVALGHDISLGPDSGEETSKA